MIISIQKADINNIEDCKEALVKSELGREYFPVEASAISSLKTGFEKDDIYVALDERATFLGFIWYTLKGAFHSFPYLHIIAVKKEYRGKGVGKELIKFYEEKVFVDNTKMFLVVADFNKNAKRLYEQIGYKEVGRIPDLYKKGVSEYLMMKVKSQE